MKKILLVLILGAFSAILLTPTASAEGAYRIGSSQDGGKFYAAVGVEVNAADSVAATMVAEDQCDLAVPLLPGAIPVNNDDPTLFCQDSPTSANNSSLPDQTIEDNECIVAVLAATNTSEENEIPPGGAARFIGVGIEDSCEEAYRAATVSCELCLGSRRPYAITLHNDGDEAFYLRDGNATICRGDKIELAADAAPDDPAMLANTCMCEGNLVDRDGSCQCPVGEFPASVGSTTCVACGANQLVGDVSGECECNGFSVNTAATGADLMCVVCGENQISDGMENAQCICAADSYNSPDAAGNLNCLVCDGANQIPNSDQSACVCDGTSIDMNADTNILDCQMCGHNEVSNDMNQCVCESGTERTNSADGICLSIIENCPEATTKGNYNTCDCDDSSKVYNRNSNSCDACNSGYAELQREFQSDPLICRLCADLNREPAINSSCSQNCLPGYVYVDDSGNPSGQVHFSGRGACYQCDSGYNDESEPGVCVADATCSENAVGLVAGSNSRCECNTGYNDEIEHGTCMPDVDCTDTEAETGVSLDGNSRCECRENYNNIANPGECVADAACTGDNQRETEDDPTLCECEDEFVNFGSETELDCQMCGDNQEFNDGSCICGDNAIATNAVGEDLVCETCGSNQQKINDTSCACIATAVDMNADADILDCQMCGDNQTIADNACVCVASAVDMNAAPDILDCQMCGDNQTIDNGACVCNDNAVDMNDSDSVLDCQVCGDNQEIDAETDSCVCNNNAFAINAEGEDLACQPCGINQELNAAQNGCICNADSIDTNGDENVLNCQICGDNQIANDADNACICDAVSFAANDDDADLACQVCGVNAEPLADDSACFCSDGFVDDGDGNCIIECIDGDNQIANELGDTCICESGFVQDPAESILACIVFQLSPSFLLAGDGTTEESPFLIEEPAVADAIMITVAANGTGDYEYRKSAGSDELSVTDDGVVYFSSTPGNGEYFIVVSARMASTVSESSAGNSAAAANVIAQTETNPPEIILYFSIDMPSAAEQSASTYKDERYYVIVPVVGLAAYLAYLALADTHDLRWTPSYSFHGHNADVSYWVGNRWQAATDNWHFYWQTSYGNRQQFVYGSGISYNNGIFSAVLDSEALKDESGLDLSLSANQTWGVWQLDGGYNFGLQMSATDTDTQNRLNIAARYSLDRWILSANAHTNGKAATARLDYTYRF